MDHIHVKFIFIRSIIMHAACISHIVFYFSSVFTYSPGYFFFPMKSIFRRKSLGIYRSHAESEHFICIASFVLLCFVLFWFVWFSFHFRISIKWETPIHMICIVQCSVFSGRRVGLEQIELIYLCSSLEFMFG